MTDKAWEATKQLVVMVEYVRAQLNAKPDSVWHFETTASGGAMAKHSLIKDFLLGSKEKGGLGFALTEISQCQVGGPYKPTYIFHNNKHLAREAGVDHERSADAWKAYGECVYVCTSKRPGLCFGRHRQLRGCRCVWAEARSCRPVEGRRVPEKM